jgi:hypothetical protein
MAAGVVDRRGVLLGSAAGAGLGVLGALAAPTASAAGIDTRAALAAALDRYVATRVVGIGLVLRDNRDGGRFIWRPRTLQSYSTIKVLILVATLKRAQDRGLALTTTQRSLASRMIRYSDNAATDTLLAQIGVATCQRVANQLGMSHTVDDVDRRPRPPDELPRARHLPDLGAAGLRARPDGHGHREPAVGAG